MARFEPFHYEGTVWCVSVPTKCFVARRNGKVFVTGNTGMPKGFIKDKNWKGYGTGLKPVTEHWILARKPLGEKSVAANLERWLTGALRIDECRVGANAGWSYPNGKGGSPLHGGGFKDIPCEATKGRYPPHMILGHAPGCALTGTKKVKTGKAHRTKSGGDSFGGSRKKKVQPDMAYGDAEGNEIVPVFECTPGCPVALIDAQALAGGMHGAGKKRRGGLGTGRNAPLYRGQGRPDASNGTRFGDQGGPSRFWPTFHYCPKASRAEKEAGLGDEFEEKDWREGTKNSTPHSGQIYEQVGRKGAPRKNSHSTVKPVKLMRWLTRLIVHPGQRVLDPFAGSGSTGIGVLAEGSKFVGIEEDLEYWRIAGARLRHAEKAGVA